jgi:AraC family transcriptional regulator
MGNEVTDVNWMDSIREAISYIERNLAEELTVEEIAQQASLSPYYFQKGFAMLCGFTVGEYIRQRRLTLAGSEVVSTDHKIIDIALAYGYDSPDSFTKAFTRFHGVTPTAARKYGAMVKSFSSLKIKFVLEGGNVMDYRIMKKESFTVMGVSRTFKYEDAKELIPGFWTELHQSENEKIVCGMYGVCIDESTESDEFEYLIADNYDPSADIKQGCVTRIIPAHTWAVFPCKGAMPQSLQDRNKEIFSEWLPNCRDYEIAAGYNIELYSDPAEYPMGTQDKNYHSEIWIPVKGKEQE